MHTWPLAEADRITCFLSTDKHGWLMQDGFGRMEPFYRPILHRLRQELPGALNCFESGCRQCQPSNSWLMLWYDGLKCIHFELDVCQHRDARVGSVLIGVHIEEEANERLLAQVRDYAPSEATGIEDAGQVCGRRICITKFDDANAHQVATQIIDMISHWGLLMQRAMAGSTPCHHA